MSGPSTFPPDRSPRRRPRTPTWLLLLLACGCRSRVPVADLGSLYDRVAQEHHEGRNPVILIPGILGSNLEQAGTGRVVWGAFEGDYANPSSPDGARLVALPMQAGAPLAALVDDVVVAGALASLRVRLFGLHLGVRAYVNILSALGVGGYRDEALGLSGTVDYGAEHFTCFQFAYDWRRDLIENARALDAFVREKEAYVRAETLRRTGRAPGPLRFDVVAHSMGGLLLRYWLRHGTADLGDEGELPPITWAGAEHVERAVLIGTPNAGSGEAFRQLLLGAKLGPFLPRYPPAVLGTMPAVYELLPRPRHGFWRLAGAAHDAAEPDWLAPETWERFGWGLADPRQEGVLRALLPDEPDPAARRRIALDHQAKCLRRARRLFEALDRPAAPPAPTELVLVAGDAVDTLAGATVDASSGRVVFDRSAAGDGTVTRASALCDERTDASWRPVLRSPVAWRRVFFFFEDHLGLTRAPAFIDNLLFLLLEEPRPARGEGA